MLRTTNKCLPQIHWNMVLKTETNDFISAKHVCLPSIFIEILFSVRTSLHLKIQLLATYRTVRHCVHTLAVWKTSVSISREPLEMCLSLAINRVK